VTARNAGEPIEAVASDGIVMILIDTTTARQLADAWEFTQASGGLNVPQRPTFLLDVLAIRRAAIAADQQAGVELADVRFVPVGYDPAGPRLRVVGDES
jgi:hypothetical protein